MSLSAGPRMARSTVFSCVLALPARTSEIAKTAITQIRRMGRNTCRPLACSGTQAPVRQSTAKSALPGSLFRTRTRAAGRTWCDGVPDQDSLVVEAQIGVDDISDVHPNA